MRFPLRSFKKFALALLLAGVAAPSFATCPSGQCQFQVYIPGLVGAAPVVYPAVTNGEVFSFSPCGAAGASGPTSAQCSSTYASTNLNGWVAVSGGIQMWTVPATGTWVVKLAGAAGQPAQDIGNAGDGAVFTTTLSLVQGEQVQIVVGQMGTAGSYGSGGGGGTFVVANGSLLAVAGGGGGGGTSAGGVSGYNATVSSSSEAAICTGGGGGGYAANGITYSGYSNYGSAFINGAAGGPQNGSGFGAGGFGGGGSGAGVPQCVDYGGGGGGYTANSGGGVGGNSYSTGAMSSSSTNNAGAGYVTFTYN